MPPLLKAQKWYYTPRQTRAFFKAKLNAPLEEDFWTLQAAIKEARCPRTRDYLKKCYENRIKPSIDADLAELIK